MAYRKPSESPAAHLLQQAQRQKCADAVNAMLLQMQGHDALFSVERVQRQLLTVQQHLQGFDSVQAQAFTHMLDNCNEALSDAQTRNDEQDSVQAMDTGNQAMESEAG